jgi:hypothetical protein
MNKRAFVVGMFIGLIIFSLSFYVLQSAILATGIVIIVGSAGLVLVKIVVG